ncbi:MAG: glycerophosphodiester phosphodiesterase family protein, partial [Vicingaceae bacterium]
MTTNNKITVTGHRGAGGLAPENTLASIQLALDLGVDRIEIDVQQTKDNVVIVLHDRTLRRTTTGIGYV